MSLPSFDMLGAKLYPVLDWFIPRPMKAEMELLRRARMFLISHLFGPFLGHTISLYILFIDPHPDWAWYGFFGIITAFWIFPFALKATGWYVPLALLSVENLIFTILWGCYHYGGTSSPLIPWVITVPLLAFFYLGSGTSIRAFVLSIIVVNLAAFYAIYSLGNGFPQHVPLDQLSGLGLVSMFCAAVYVAMMALYYANIVNSQSELEREVKKRMETAQRLREATDEAQHANQAKSDFLAKMSHELRTPLNAVIGYSAILLDEMKNGADAERCRDLKKIHNAGKRLLKLITDLLDLSKLEAGKMGLFVEPIGIAPLIEDVVDEFREQIADSGNRLTIECDSKLVIEADQIKLRRAIADLVGNAIKYTTDGQISIQVTANAEWLRVSVNDNGAGIEEAVLPVLFEPFKASEEETNSKYAEIGLGLPVSQRLCQLMGGGITAISKRGRGSSFTIRVPVKVKAPAEAVGEATSAVGSQMRDGNQTILIVDDDRSVLETTQELIAAEGFVPLVAASVDDGLAILATHRPAMILLDVLMPRRDGWDMLLTLKSDPRTADCPVVMLTDDVDCERSLALGAVGHISKPLTPRELYRALEAASLTNSSRDGAFHRTAA
jgi:signal transduction histidine kinase/ActR/RegA family two-component response regulator